MGTKKQSGNALPLSACHRWDNGDFIAVLYRRLFSMQKADIFIIEVEVSELPDRSSVIAQLCSQTREVTHQVVEHVVHRDALDMDLALLGESLQRRRNQHQNRHISSPSAMTAYCCRHPPSGQAPPRCALAVQLPQVVAVSPAYLQSSTVPQSCRP